MKTKLIPPDAQQCQAEKWEGCLPDAQHFMILGPAQRVRCKNKPTVIITEVKPGDDGQRGSMSLCDACLKVAITQLGASAFKSNPIKP